MSAEKHGRLRALFKKGQKCIVPISEEKEDGEEDITYYPAVITRGEKRTDPDTKEATYHYWIHYVGFGNSYDAEVEEKDLLKYDVDLLTGGISAAADEARARAQDAAEAKRQKERLSEIPSQLRLRIPHLLKQVVLDDYVLITQQGRILPLPRPSHARPSAGQTIHDWQSFRKSDEDEETCEQIDEIADGLVSYFDNALRHFLLFQPEVAACDAALASGAPPSEVYGAEHLVRLLTKLPELVSVLLMTSGGDALNVVTLEDEISDFMAWATEVKTQGRLFSTKEEYIANPHWTPPLHEQVQTALQGIVGTTPGELNNNERSNVNEGREAGGATGEPAAVKS